MKWVVADTQGFNCSCWRLHVLSWYSPFLWVLLACCHTPGRCTPGHLVVELAPSCARDSGVCPETAYQRFSCECAACQTLLSAFLMTCDIKALCFRLMRRKCLLLWAEPSAGRALETRAPCRLCPIPCCVVCFLCSVPIFSLRTANCQRPLLASDGDECEALSSSIFMPVHSGY